MELLFNLTNCKTTFLAGDFRRTEVSFRARPNRFTIITPDTVVIHEDTDFSEDESQIEVALLADDFESGVHGYMTPFSGWGIQIALACTLEQIQILHQYLCNGQKPQELQITIPDRKLTMRNFKMENQQYPISKWSFDISSL
jgi:hypothetical protein